MCRAAAADVDTTMLERARLLLILATLAGCSASGGTGYGYGAGGSGSNQCAAGSCELCADCLSTCMCATGNATECNSACGGWGASGSGAGGGSGFGGAGAVPGAGGAPPTNCQYPPEPFGKSPNQTVGPTLQWDGFRDGDSAPTTINIQEYFDCDGSRGTNALLLVSAAQWCPNCQKESAELNAHMQGDWGAMGIKVLVLMVEDLNSNPATFQTAQAWFSRYQPRGWSVVADPNFYFAKAGTNGVPVNMVVNPRNMMIVNRQDGYSPAYPTLENLAQANAP